MKKIQNMIFRVFYSIIALAIVEVEGLTRRSPTAS